MKRLAYAVFVINMFCFHAALCMNNIVPAPKTHQYDSKQGNYLDILPVELSNTIVSDVFRNVSQKTTSDELFDPSSLRCLAKTSTNCFYMVKAFLDQFKHVQYCKNYIQQNRKLLTHEEYYYKLQSIVQRLLGNKDHEKYEAASKLDSDSDAAITSFYASTQDLLLSWHHKYWSALISDLYSEELLQKIEKDDAFIPGFQSLYVRICINRLSDNIDRLKKILTRAGTYGAATGFDVDCFVDVGRYDIAELLIENNPLALLDIVDRDSNTLLHSLLHGVYDEVDIVRIISYLEKLKPSEDVSLRIHTKNYRGNTLLHQVLFVKNSNQKEVIVKKLFDYKALPTIKNDDQRVPLHLACYKNDLECCKLLLESDKTIINVQDTAGYTPLHDVVCQDGDVSEEYKLKIVTLLLDSGSRVDIQSASGKTALNMAQRQGLYRIARMLADYTAKNGSQRALSEDHDM